MPIYEFKNKKTKKIHEKFFSWSERETYLKDHPELEAVMSQTQVGDPVMLGYKKPDQWFRNKLRAIKQANPGSNINDFSSQH